MAADMPMEDKVLLREYDETHFVPCVPTAYFKTKNDLIKYLTKNFCVFKDISVSLDKEPDSIVRQEAIHDAEAVTVEGAYRSQRLIRYQGCCDPIMIFDPSIESWDPKEPIIQKSRPEGSYDKVKSGEMTLEDYWKVPLSVHEHVVCERFYMVPKDFYNSWYSKASDDAAADDDDT
jgi:hypothetical protein